MKVSPEEAVKTAQKEEKGGLKDISFEKKLVSGVIKLNY